MHFQYLILYEGLETVVVELPKSILLNYKTYPTIYTLTYLSLRSFNIWTENILSGQNTYRNYKYK